MLLVGVCDVVALLRSVMFYWSVVPDTVVRHYPNPWNRGGFERKLQDKETTSEVSPVVSGQHEWILGWILRSI